MARDDDKTRDLPSGLVTFVFTDIEGSTRLYRALGEDGAGDVFDMHNEILRDSWVSHNGAEVHTEGDSFFVAFEDPNDAVAACIKLQQVIGATEWPDGGEVRVRVGIHSGLAAPRNNDYMALSVHQAARVMSAAHGGQILITDTVMARLDPIPTAAALRVGAFRLRDFDETPVLHRIDPAGLEKNEAPPRATPANQHNLVLPLTSFIGRESDSVAINGLLAPGTAVTIVGLGGMGKTRLVTEVGIRVATDWASGVWMVELADVTDSDLIVNEIAMAIGAGPGSAEDRWLDLVTAVGDQQMLIILDNVEQLVDACSRLVPELLQACPNLTIISTSREPLNCAGEIIYRLRPLTGSPSTDAAGTAATAQLPSVELFIDRARSVSPEFSWTPEALRDAAEICSHVDGLPLAIEIAAAQVGVLKLSEIVDGLSSRFKLLRSRDRSLPDRHRTMEGLLDWSHRLLTENEQRALRRLAVFGGSFSIDAAEATLPSDGIRANDVAELIWALVDKSLIAADLSDAATRYRLFESVQQYAMQQLTDNEELSRTAVAHTRWLLERVAPWQVNDRRWLGDVAIELANVRANVDLIADVEPELAQQLMCSVGRYHDSVQAYSTGIDELTRRAEKLDAATPSRVALLAEIGDLHLRMANSDAAAELLDAASELEDQVGAADWNDVAISRLRGEIAMRSGDHDAVVAIADEALASPLSQRGTARMWSLIGVARASSGDLLQGRLALEKVLSIYTSLNDAPAVAIAHSNMAEVAWRLDDYNGAARHQRVCLEEGLAIGQQVAVANSLIMAAQLAGHRRDWTTALALQSHADAILQDAGHELYADDRTAIERLRELAAADLSHEHATQAEANGRELTIVDAVAMAQATFESELISEPSETCSPTS